jgi:hypothetical protein
MTTAEMGFHVYFSTISSRPPGARPALCRARCAYLFDV